LRRRQGLSLLRDTHRFLGEGLAKVQLSTLDVSAVRELHLRLRWVCDLDSVLDTSRALMHNL